MYYISALLVMMMIMMMIIMIMMMMMTQKGRHSTYKSKIRRVLKQKMGKQSMDSILEI